MLRLLDRALSALTSWPPWGALLAGCRSHGKRAALIRSCIRVAWLRVTQPGVRVGFDSFVGPGCRIRCAEGAEIRLERTTLSRDVTLDADAGACLRLAAAFVGPGSIFAAKERIDIGERCQIADYVTIRDHDHRHGVGLDLSTLRFSTSPVHVEPNVWLGSKATVVAGVRIGEDALVAAGAVVTKDVAAGDRVGGIPARSLPRG